MPKLEIPLFDESNPRWWVGRCEHAFGWYNVLKGQRVALAVAYLNNAGDAWYQGWLQVRGDCPWGEFADKLYEVRG